MFLSDSRLRYRNQLSASLISVVNMPATPSAAVKARKRKLTKTVTAKEKRHRIESQVAYEMCKVPPFLNDFPDDVRDLISAKLSIYHARLGTKAFNLIAPVMLIHLMEYSSIDSIPPISRHAGWSFQVYILVAGFFATFHQQV